MQTRSMTRRGLERSSSLQARETPSVETTVQTRSMTRRALERSASLNPTDETISDERALVALPDESSTVTTYSRDCQPEQANQAQQAFASFVHAHASAQAMSNRNTELLLQQAVAQTEVRLTATAHALVQQHAAEQAHETRRSLEGAIQQALIGAHMQAQEQAVAAANDQLQVFMREIREKTQSQLQSTINGVSTDGVAYIERVTKERLNEMSTTIDSLIKNVEFATTSAQNDVNRAAATDVAALREAVGSMIAQMNMMKSEFSVQLVDAEKRCYDHAILTSSAQTEGMIAQLETRLTRDIESRLANAEAQAAERVTAAVIRAETHCNVVETRSRESVDRAISDLRASHGGQLSSRIDAPAIEVIERTIEPRISEYFTKYMDSRLTPTIAQIAQERVDMCINQTMEPKVNKLFDKYVDSRLTPAIARIARERVDMCLDQKIEPRVNEQFDKYVDSRLTPTLTPTITRIARERVDMCIDQKIEPSVSEHFAKFVDSRLTPKLTPTITRIAQERVDVCINQKIEPSVSEHFAKFVDSRMTPMLTPTIARVARERVDACIDQLITQKLDAAATDLVKRVEGRTLAMLGDARDEMAAKLSHKLSRDKTGELDVHLVRTEAILLTSVPKAVKDQLDVRLSPQFESMEMKILARVEQQLHEKVYPRVDGAVAALESKLSDRFGAVARPLPTLYTAEPPANTVAESAAPPSNSVVHKNIKIKTEGEAKIGFALKKAYAMTSYATSARNNQELSSSESDDEPVFNPHAILQARQKARKSISSARSTESIPKPALLTSMRHEELATFTKQYQQYAAHSGRSPWTDFVKPGVLAYLRSVEGDGEMGDEHLFQVLFAKVMAGTTDPASLDKKFRAVKIDPQASTSTEKVQSILIGLENVLADTAVGVQGSVAHVPLATHMEIVISKLPRELQEKIQTKLKFSSVIQSKGEFARILLEEARSFQWPSRVKFEQ